VYNCNTETLRRTKQDKHHNIDDAMVPAVKITNPEVRWADIDLVSNVIDKMRIVGKERTAEHGDMNLLRFGNNVHCLDHLIHDTVQ